MKDETERLTDTSTGPMNVLIDNYNGIIDGIDDKIAREERRVALVQSRLDADLGEFAVGAVIQFRSELHPSGARYTPLWEASLGASAK